jgi:hypothetical protein
MNEINIRFASKAEAQELIPGNTQYYNRLKQMDIDWRARKENATLDELIAFEGIRHPHRPRAVPLHHPPLARVP